MLERRVAELEASPDEYVSLIDDEGEPVRAVKLGDVRGKARVECADRAKDTYAPDLPTCLATLPRTPPQRRIATALSHRVILVTVPHARGKRAKGQCLHLSAIP